MHPNTKNPFCDASCYGEWQKGKSFAQQSKTERAKKQCCVDGCEKEHFGRGYCRKHYISLHYSPPKKTSKEVHKHHKCTHCGKDFIAYHQSPKFCSASCYGDSRKKPFIIKNGYRKLLIPHHPRADGKGYVFEHIVVAEASAGRALRVGEVVHHIDHNKQNNDPNNLQICASHSDHMKLHARPL